MRQRRWLELLADYDCEIRYHPRKQLTSRCPNAERNDQDHSEVRSLVIPFTKIPITNTQAQTKGIQGRKTQGIENYETEQMHLTILPEMELRKCLSDESLVIPMKELRLDDKLNFVEEPVEIMD
ncbi:hypothetical protein Tco_1033980 [Tanacetum coccineum]